MRREPGGAADERGRPPGDRSAARRRAPRPRGEALLALAGVGFLLAVTAAWWALALWPLPATAPGWLERTQAVCFGLTDSGLPGAAGWLLLVGQPLAMAAALAVIAGRPLRLGLVELARSGGGRVALASAALFATAGVAAAGVRVAGASDGGIHELRAADLLPEEHPRLDLDLPAFALVDPLGREVGPEHLVGRPTLVTFAFGNCGTICPLLVRSALEARDRHGGEAGVRVVVITLDPWRDTVDRLLPLAARWGLGEADLLLGGSVPAVEAALDAWRVSRSRDARSGDVAHPPLTYVVDPSGRIAFAARGDAATLVALLGRL